MITRDDLEAAIAECHGKRNPDANTCIKLAAYYTIRDALYSDRYSYAQAPEAIEVESGTRFAEVVNGKRPSDVWPIIDELMSTLQVIQPRLYNVVMEKLS